MNKNQSQPPPVLRPGDDPRVDALLEELRADGGSADPLYVDYRRKRGPRPAAGAVPEPAAAAPVSPGRRRGTWIALAALVMVAPLLALALGVLFESLRQVKETAPASGQEAPAQAIAASHAPTAAASAGAGEPPLPAQAAAEVAAPTGAPGAATVAPSAAVAASARPRSGTGVPPSRTPGAPASAPESRTPPPAPAGTADQSAAGAATSGDFFFRRRPGR